MIIVRTFEWDNGTNNVFGQSGWTLNLGQETNFPLSGIGVAETVFKGRNKETEAFGDVRYQVDKLRRNYEGDKLIVRVDSSAGKTEVFKA